ncbi:hypothetical protein EXIGLDRAFT_143366 [Exidia glandulosa HHB12029]|uniref:Mid2 domain-containing protein n=1 Tax=Exidia glandulosa HHB12029 TaxID=1314781 RepID=A0A165NBH5_EXIGL|nr:hypothetical protein EXIGLDRAFT_143366 [Exidia glandulosa HHB12029]
MLARLLIVPALAATSLAAVVPMGFLQLIHNNNNEYEVVTATPTPTAVEPPATGIYTSDYINGTMEPELLLPDPTTTATPPPGTPTETTYSEKADAKDKTANTIVIALTIGYTLAIVIGVLSLCCRTCTGRRLSRERYERGLVDPPTIERDEALQWPQLNAKHNIYSADAWGQKMRVEHALYNDHKQ